MFSNLMMKRRNRISSSLWFVSLRELMKARNYMSVLNMFKSGLFSQKRKGGILFLFFFLLHIFSILCVDRNQKKTLAELNYLIVQHIILLWQSTNSIFILVQLQKIFKITICKSDYETSMATSIQAKDVTPLRAEDWEHILSANT